MDRVLISLTNFASDARSERGATGVEYGIMVAAIAAVIVVVAFSLGDVIAAAFQTVLDEF